MTSSSESRLSSRDAAHGTRSSGIGGSAAGPRGARYSLRTLDGQRVHLDGHARTLVLTDGHGSTVELGPDLVRLTAATDLLIEAPGRGLRLRAKTVDFEEAP